MEKGLILVCLLRGVGRLIMTTLSTLAETNCSYFLWKCAFCILSLTLTRGNECICVVNTKYTQAII